MRKICVTLNGAEPHIDESARGRDFAMAKLLLLVPHPRLAEQG
jgi:hypothetical protein